MGTPEEKGPVDLGAVVESLVKLVLSLNRMRQITDTLHTKQIDLLHKRVVELEQRLEKLDAEAVS